MRGTALAGRDTPTPTPTPRPCSSSTGTFMALRRAPGTGNLQSTDTVRKSKQVGEKFGDGSSPMTQFESQNELGKSLGTGSLSDDTVQNQSEFSSNWHFTGTQRASDSHAALAMAQSAPWAAPCTCCQTFKPTHGTLEKTTMGFHGRHSRSLVS